METITLNAQVRRERKKGPSRRLRAEGLTPAIIYGFQTEPIMLTVKSFDLKKILEKIRKESIFVKLEIEDGKKKTEKLSILKDIQINTLKKRLDHADFYEIRMDAALIIDVPILVTGEAPGVEKGGELIMSRRELKISGLPSKLPEMIEVDVSTLEIGDSVKIRDITLKEGVTALDPEGIVVASVSMTRAAMAAAGVGGEEEETSEEMVSEGVPVSEEQASDAEE
ncbi:MAG: 50S ribosomal protein L25 [Deltaproteobacteria bacterium]|nr:50S ribosomal protein L25 [Deltaproteobacteria bacterium]